MLSGVTYDTALYYEREKGRTQNSEFRARERQLKTNCSADLSLRLYDPRLFLVIFTCTRAKNGRQNGGDR